MGEVSTTVVVLLAGAWVLQIILSSLQMRRFHRKSQELRRSGKYMAIGMSGTTYRRKTYVAIGTDEDNRVTGGLQLSGFTVAAGAKPIAGIEGLDIDDVGREEPPEGINSKTWAALDHAAGFIRRQLVKEANEAAEAAGTEDEI